MKQMKFINIVRQAGIGLLELMLSLAIIAVLLIMATRYYSSAHSNQQISQAVDQFTSIAGAVRNWRVDNPFEAVSGLTVGKLNTDGYLPSSITSTSNPWRGSTTLKNQGGAKFTIEMTNVPAETCDKLETRLQGSFDPNATCNGTTMTGEFTL